MKFNIDINNILTVTGLKCGAKPYDTARAIHVLLAICGNTDICYMVTAYTHIYTYINQYKNAYLYVSLLESASRDILGYTITTISIYYISVDHSEVHTRLNMKLRNPDIELETYIFIN
jgi:hypothetical protein